MSTSNETQPQPEQEINENKSTVIESLSLTTKIEEKIETNTQTQMENSHTTTQDIVQEADQVFLGESNKESEKQEAKIEIKENEAPVEPQEQPKQIEQVLISSAEAINNETLSQEIEPGASEKKEEIKEDIKERKEQIKSRGRRSTRKKEDQDKEKLETKKNGDKPSKEVKEAKAEDKDMQTEKPWLEQPLTLTGKRERKTIDRFKVIPKENQKQILIEQGTGVKFGDLPRVVHFIDKTLSDNLRLLHRVCFGVFGKKNDTKRNLKQFSGFAFTRTSPDFEKKANFLKKGTLSELREICKVIDVNKEGAKEEIVNRIMDFLMEPKESGLEIPTTPVTKRKSSVKRKRKTSETKEKRESEAKSESEKDDEELLKSKEREVPKIKRKKIEKEPSSESNKKENKEDEDKHEKETIQKKRGRVPGQRVTKQQEKTKEAPIMINKRSIKESKVVEKASKSLVTKKETKNLKATKQTKQEKRKMTEKPTTTAGVKRKRNLNTNENGDPTNGNHEEPDSKRLKISENEEGKNGIEKEKPSSEKNEISIN